MRPKSNIFKIIKNFLKKIKNFFDKLKLICYYINIKLRDINKNEDLKND